MMEPPGKPGRFRSIKSPQIVEVLKTLQATIGKKLLIICDRLQAHRSMTVRAHV